MMTSTSALRGRCRDVQDECSKILGVVGEDDVDVVDGEGLDDEGQERIRKLGRGMVEPTQQERDDHVISHVPYRACVVIV